jgi:peptidoglycan/LPS O-acetylase OafA/YrhL
MTVSLRKVASTALLATWLISTAFQLWRASLDTGVSVDRLTPALAIGYVFFIALALFVRADRRWAWWLAAISSAAVLVEAVTYYYPTAYDARPLEFWDWLEGTLFTGLLLVALGCCVLRLLDATLTAEPTGRRDGDPARPADRDPSA